MDNRTDIEKEQSPYFSHWVYTGNAIQRWLRIGPKKAMYKNQRAQMEELISALDGGEVAEIVFSTPQGTYNVTDSARKALLKPNWWEDYTGALEGSDYSHLYKKSQWAYRCIQIRAQALGAIPWKLMKGDEEVEKHEIIDLLTEVNPENNWEDLIRATESDLNIYPGAYWLKIRPEGMKNVAFLQRLNPATMEVVADKTGIRNFKQRNGKKYDREDIVYFRTYNPISDVSGTPPIQIAKGDIEVEIEANKHLANFFENHAMPHFIFSVDTNDPNTLKKLQRDWERRHGAGTHKTAFVGGKADPKEMGYAPDKLALKDIREESRRGICAAFGVPPALVGAWEAANYATLEIQRKFLYTEVIIPQARYIQGVINAELVQKIDPSVEFVFDYQALPIMQEDESEKAERYALLVREGVMDSEAAAEELGVKPAIREDVKGTPESNSLAKWRRKALNRFKKTGNASCEFESEQVSPIVKGFIEGRLENAETLEEINGIFEAAAKSGI